MDNDKIIRFHEDVEQELSDSLNDIVDNLSKEYGISYEEGMDIYQNQYYEIEW
jgi:hypothetical protein